MIGMKIIRVIIITINDVFKPVPKNKYEIIKAATEKAIPSP